jgi:hypothetical protein
MADNYKKLVSNLLTNLQDRKILKPNVEYMSNTGLIRRNITIQSYSTIFHGTAKECHAFLSGIDFISQS